MKKCIFCDQAMEETQVKCPSCSKSQLSETEIRSRVSYIKSRYKRRITGAVTTILISIFIYQIISDFHNPGLFFALIGYLASVAFVVAIVVVARVTWQYVRLNKREPEQVVAEYESTLKTEEKVWRETDRRLVLGAFVVLLLAITNPSFEVHKNAIWESSLGEAARTNNIDHADFFAKLNDAFTMKYRNFIVFSFISAEGGKDGGAELFTIGILGHSIVKGELYQSGFLGSE